MDTLVYSASTFLIPINIAAVNGKYDLMNVYLLLCLTSWAHHSNMHICGEESFYDDIDKLMCYIAIYYTLMYALAHMDLIRLVLYCICLLGVFVSFAYVHTNAHYTVRGIENWRYHIPHICMHLSACLGFIVIS